MFNIIIAGGLNMKENNKLQLMDSSLEDMANLFKVLGDVTRTRILSALQNGELNVSNISLAVNLPISAVSHQLRILRQAKLIKPRKVGKEVFYSLDDEHVSLIFNCAYEHVMEK